VIIHANYTIDFTPAGAATQLEPFFKEHERLRGKRFEMIK
jgi:hypothetical protein